MQEIELGIIQFIQSFSSPFLDKFFEAVTMIGEETFYILIFCWVYWCYDKAIGKGLVLTFLLGDCVNTGVKEALHMQRPIGMEGVRSLREHTATGFAFPSGHTQGTATFFYYCSQQIKKAWFSIAAWVIIILVALSRLYLGVHWPKDVIAAILFAVLIVHFGRKFFKEINLTKVIASLIVVNGLLIFLSSKGYITSVAVFSGGLLGIYLEERFVKYEIQKKFIKNAIKFIIGLAVVFAIKEGVKALAPEMPVFDYIRYFLIGVWVSFGAPAVFKRNKEKTNS